MTSYPPLFRVALVRSETDSIDDRPFVRGPAEAARIARDAWPDDGVETFGILLLDARRRVTGVVHISRGCLTSSYVHPREVMGPACAHKAASLILVHNHPSGDPEPSPDDLPLTRRLHACGALLGIPVTDHIILGDGTAEWVSLAMYRDGTFWRRMAGEPDQDESCAAA